MLNREKHQLLMGKILKDICTDVEIAGLLGFKGGTCAYFFYQLPRFSVDLDFDLLSDDEKDKQIIFTKLIAILKKYGVLKDQRIKRFTIFALLSYGDTDHNIKIEINTRLQVPNIKAYFEIKEFLGISMLVAKKSYLFTSKLIALTSRRETAMRDIYDIHFFAKNNWDIDKELLQKITGKKTKVYLAECIHYIENIKSSSVMQGLGELVSVKEKQWIRDNLKTEAIFMLKNYLAAMGGQVG